MFLLARGLNPKTEPNRTEMNRKRKPNIFLSFSFRLHQFMK